MNLKWRQNLIILFSVFSILLCSCSIKEKFFSTTISQIDMKANGHTEQLHNYDSPYTICYKNKDNTYSMYIFASPIQYKTETGSYIIIDNTVVKSNKPGFSFENKANNVKAYFPRTLAKPFRIEKDADFLEFTPNWNIEGFSEAVETIFTNMYGDRVSAVVYQHNDMDLVVYATKSGIKTEIVLKRRSDSNELSFSVKTGTVSYEDKQNGYILFKNEGEIKSIIYQPLVQYTVDKGQRLDIATQMNIVREGDEFYIEMTIDKNIISDTNTEYPVKLDMSFEMYFNKIPDSTVYSKCNINNYLANYAIVGEHPTLGEGLHYARLRLNYFMTLKPENIKSANYFVKPLWYDVGKKNYKVYKSAEQWSSTQILWESKSKPNGLITETSTFLDGYLRLPMSEYVKECFGDPEWEMESIGFLMTWEKENAYSIIATSDNSFYSPFLKIDSDDLPGYFESKDNINQV